MTHFINEMNNDHLIFWGTGMENVWNFSFLDKRSTNKAFRECIKSIEVTNEKLYLINYEGLTMAG